MKACRTLICGLGIAAIVSGRAGAQDGSAVLPEPPIAFPVMPTPADPWAGDRALTSNSAARPGPLARLWHRLVDLTPAETKLLSNPGVTEEFRAGRPPATTAAPATSHRAGLAASDPDVVHAAGEPSTDPTASRWADAAIGRPAAPGSDRAGLRGSIPPPRAVPAGPGPRPTRIPPPRPASGLSSASASATTSTTIHPAQHDTARVILPAQPAAPVPQEVQDLQTSSL